MRRSILFYALMACFVRAEAQPYSSWVYPDDTGKLVYRTTSHGDRIIDYSHAGYMGGGVALPDVPTVRTVAPAKGIDDYSEMIQKAVDEVSALPLKDGFRGAVLLMPGEYPCSRSITIAADGVVIRGSGSGQHKQSTLRMYGEKHTALVIRNPHRGNEGKQESGSHARITDSYIPCGAYAFHVDDARDFKSGDAILIRKPVTQKWVEFMGMHDMVRNGKPQTWIPVGTLLTTERVIEKVEGNTVTVTVPLVDSYDAAYTDSNITMVHAPAHAWVRQSGIEHLRIVSPPQAVSHTVALYYGIRVAGEDCWVDDVDLFETMESVGATGQRITFRNVSVVRKALHQGSSKPAEFAPNAGQILMDHCSVEGDNIWFVAVGARISGPVVLLNCTFKGNGRIEGHQRWSTGFLMDNCHVPGGGIDFKNRGEMGSGHGWGTAWAVAWNCEAKSYVNQQPPGCCNWVIGSMGESTPLRRPFSQEGPVLPEGFFDAHGQHVFPQSLYIAQLRERLGDEAVKVLADD